MGHGAIGRCSGGQARRHHVRPCPTCWGFSERHNAEVTVVTHSGYCIISLTLPWSACFAQRVGILCFCASFVVFSCTSPFVCTCNFIFLKDHFGCDPFLIRRGSSLDGPFAPPEVAGLTVGMQRRGDTRHTQGILYHIAGHDSAGVTCPVGWYPLFLCRCNSP